MTFSLNVFDSLLQGSGHDTSYLHSNGFNPETNCPVPAAEHSERECCGDYPHRRPYKTLQGQHACCSGTVYSTIGNYQCCEQNDGSFELDFVCT